MTTAAALRYLERSVATPEDSVPVELLLAPVTGRAAALAAAAVDRDTWCALRRVWAAHADRVTRALTHADRTADHGWLTLTVKDTMDVAGMPTTLGHATHRHYPAVSADAARRLRDLGLAIVGKAYATELNIGPPGEVLNPAFPDLSPGGSSTGSAVAVAAGISDYALATDVLGSTRWPATNCGIAGLRLTWHPARLAGVLPVSPSQDSVGLMARTVEDLRLLWDRGPVQFPHRTPAVDSPVVATVANAASAAPAVTAAVRHAADALRDLGVAVTGIELSADAWATRELAWELCAADVAEVVAEAESRLGLRLSAPARASLREPVTSARRQQLLAAQRAYRRDMVAILDRAGVDILLLPVSSTPPKRVVERAGKPTLPRPGDPDYTDRVGYTPIASFAGLPALVQPCLVSDPLGPLGIQLIGRPGCERVLLDLGSRLERHLGTHREITARVAKTLSGGSAC